MNSAWKSYGCIFVAGCLWGTNGLFVKLMQGAGSTSAYTGFVYALIPTGICYIIYFNGVSKIKESSKVPVVASVENVVAVIVGVAIFHEKVGTGNLIGIALVLGTIAVMNMELPLLGKNMFKRVSVASKKHVHVQ